ncbi:mitochondrial carnitine/acylcarnitine carrier protein-like [Hydractinia symbiolongicarpus]|uniref:mitochondrial carnitine/acylcarnitine carrier protein-like n=1 Tax=Hydractinia symbiolongicarpus TaxID=13093 RepID=UPI002550BF52|nr:mitochondrial carnitine/acylcarnitine carrier protein-like [Hydractinia symbiolongicarpus]
MTKELTHMDIDNQNITAPAPPPLPSPLKNFIAGGVGGICLVVTGQPLDTIKVRLQTQNVKAGEAPLYRGTFDCGKKIIQREGFRGFYKGMATVLIGITPIIAISFFGFGVGKKLQTTDVKQELTLPQIWNAGMVAGVFTTVVTVPPERVKCLLQIQTGGRKNSKYNGAWDCAKKIYLEEGFFRGFYRGTAATLLRDVPASGAYFMSYEMLLRYLTPEGESRAHLNPLRFLVAGGTAGVIDWIVAIGPDTLKSRFQTAPPGTYTGIRDVFRKLVKQEGITALFKGLTPVMIRAFPTSAVCFLGYEVTIQALNALW